MSNKIAKLIELRRQIQRDFGFEQTPQVRLAALTYIIRDKEYEKTKIKDMVKAIRRKKGIKFSAGMMKLLLAVFIDTSMGDFEIALDKIVTAKKILKDAKYRDGNYLPLCAYSLAVRYETEYEMTDASLRGMEIFKLMRKNHPILTGQDDYMLSLLLASKTEKSIQSVIDDMEECYNALHDAGFHRGNHMQFMSHILTLENNDAKIKAVRTFDLKDVLKAAKVRIGSYGYGSLALLSMISAHDATAVVKVSELVHELKGQRGYKTAGADELLTAAVGVLSTDYVGDHYIEEVTGVTMAAIIEAQNAAIIAATAAAASAAASS